MKISSSSLLLVAALAACDTTKVISPATTGGRAQFAITSDYPGTDIGASPSLIGRSSQTHAVNASGVVLGLVRNGLADPDYFSWSARTGVQFLTRPTGQSFYPDAINNRGDILGESPLGKGLWMHWSDGNWQEITLPTPLSKDGFVAGQKINSFGHVAGAYGGPGNVVAFFWSVTTGVIPIEHGCNVIPFGMNDLDQVVGVYQTVCPGPQSVFSWTPAGGFRNLGTFGGTRASASSVNVHGVIAATITYADGHATGVLISPTLAITRLPNTIGGVTTRASDVNDRGEAVGTMLPLGATNSDARPVVWDANHNATVLSTPLGPGAAVRISSNGIVVGQARVSTSVPAVNHAFVWMADQTVPVISPTVSGTLSASGWYTSDVTVTWSVTDAESAISSKVGCDPVTLSTDGIGQTVTCTGTSAGGTSSSTATVKIDKTKPAVTYTGNAGTYAVDQTVNITCTPTDNLSGVASSTCANITGDASAFALGVNTFSATATDNAGNVSAPTSTSFTVVVTPGSLSALVNQWVSNAGVANSLVGKLKHETYDAFRNEVNAQSGKKIPADKAAILLRLVAGL